MDLVEIGKFVSYILVFALGRVLGSLDLLSAVMIVIWKKPSHRSESGLVASHLL